MKTTSVLLFVCILSLLFQVSDSKQAQDNDQENYYNNIIEKVYEFLAKAGIKIIANPTLLRSSIKVLVEKTLKVSLTKSALKKIPVVGILSGLGFGAWRALKGQYGRAAAEVASGAAGATGVGIAGSLAIDVGILVADVVEQLKLRGHVK